MATFSMSQAYSTSGSCCRRLTTRSLTLDASRRAERMASTLRKFGDAYAWLAIVGILLVGVDFCVWVYRYSKMFGSK